jgi:hypothetical protein
MNSGDQRARRPRARATLAAGAMLAMPVTQCAPGPAPRSWPRPRPPRPQPALRQAMPSPPRRSGPASGACRCRPFADVATGDIAFSVGDVETPAGSLGVSATSSNTAPVPDAGIVVGGTGASRSLRATPAAGASGTTTVTVTDAGGATASASFTLTVVAGTTPVACAITFVGGTPKRVEVTASDAGSGLALTEVTTAVNIVMPVTVSPFVVGGRNHRSSGHHRHQDRPVGAGPGGLRHHGPLRQPQILQLAAGRESLKHRTGGTR